MPTRKVPGYEPIPGYRLQAPVGRGGFGEVWKCEAPGGLTKAVKFVTGRLDDAGPSVPRGDGAGELHALNHVKSIRHPFLLSIERVEVIDGDLVIVMELAEQSLHDLLQRYRAEGERGLPRPEALGYLHEAAEVLDLMNQDHDLQHLDVKPHNLFLVGRHVKVGDFGLVTSLSELYGTAPPSVHFKALTPIYAPPESFGGGISLYSDQYSLAITYHELITGALPFAAKSFREWAAQHLQAEPNLERLSPGDATVLRRALAKEPRERFGSCTEFVEALAGGPPPRGSRLTIPKLKRLDPKLVKTAIPPSNATAPLSPGRKTPRELAASSTPAATLLLDAPPLHNSAEGPAGSRLLECLAEQPGGEVWRAVSANGRPCQVRFLPTLSGVGGLTQKALFRLRNLRHPALPDREVVAAAGKLAVVTQTPGATLTEPARAFPRDELLTHVRAVAVALDELHDRHGLHHLALTPAHLLVDGPRVLLVDFGLAELCWLPVGLRAADLNPRYGAPELRAGPPGRAADQYSLALIYSELVTGTPRSGDRKKPLVPDLTLVPTVDRPALAQALDPAPDCRFPTCTAFVDALQGHSPAWVGPGLDGASTAVVPSSPTPLEAGADDRVGPPRVGSPSQLLAEQATVLRQVVNQIVTEASSRLRLTEKDGVRYLVHLDRRVEHLCAAGIPLATVVERLREFGKRWQARWSVREDGAVQFRIPFPRAGWQKWLSLTPVMDLLVCLPPLFEAGTAHPRIRIEIRSNDARKLEEMAPLLLESLREHVEAIRERRDVQRLPLERAVLLKPLTDRPEDGGGIVCTLRDVSAGGLRLYVPCRPPAEKVLVKVDPAGGVLVPGLVVRSLPCPDGHFDVGVRFLVD